MASITTSDLKSAAATSDLEVPTDIARTNDIRSLQNHAAADKPAPNTSAYKDVDWKRLKGFNIPSDNAALQSGIWL